MFDAFLYLLTMLKIMPAYVIGAGLAAVLLAMDAFD